jgi:hypothetical protein
VLPSSVICSVAQLNPSLLGTQHVLPFFIRKQQLLKGTGESLVQSSMPANALKGTVP